MFTVQCIGLILNRMVALVFYEIEGLPRAEGTNASERAMRNTWM